MVIEDHKNKKDYSNCSAKNTFDFAMTNGNECKKLKLPTTVSINNPNPGEPPFLLKRIKPAVLRAHK